MTMDALAPTRERMKRGEWLKPGTNRSEKRTAWKALDVFDRLLKGKLIDYEQRRAAEEFERRYRGWLCHDARVGNEPTFVSGRPAEFPSIKHGAEIAHMRQHLTPRQFRGLELLVTAADDVTSVGQLVCGVKNTVQARIAGLVLVQEALTTLVTLYGFATHPPSR